MRKAFVCPYHAWAYDLNGQLIGSPNVREDEHFDRSDHPLYDIAVDTYAGFLFVNMTTGGPKETLLESLTDGAETITAFERFKMDELRIGVRLTYEVKANWKIIVENYNECLHCPQVHPELVQVIPLFRFGEVWDEEIPDDGNRMMAGATSFTKTGKSELPTFPDLEPEDYEMYYGTYQFPNLLLNLHPDCAMYYIGYPKGPDHTTVVSEFMFRPETIADPELFKPEATVEFWDEISQAGLGRLRARADRRVVSRVHPRRLPASGPLPLLVQRGVAPCDGSRGARLTDRRPGQRASTDAEEHRDGERRQHDRCHQQGRGRAADRELRGEAGTEPVVDLAELSGARGGRERSSRIASRSTAAARCRRLPCCPRRPRSRR